MAASCARKVVVINFKGGVGKTTTAVNVSSGLALEGFRVLLVDADPQASATFILLKSFQHSLADLFRNEATLTQAIVNVRRNLDFIPSSKALANINTWLVESRPPHRAQVMERFLSPAAGYDSSRRARRARLRCSRTITATSKIPQVTASSAMLRC